MPGFLDFSSLNTFALNGLRLRETAFADTVNRLTSGLRLTTVGDDGAAWMVGTRLSNRYRGWNEATQNIQNGISVLEAADGGARTIHDALLRLRELAVQSANGTYTPDVRQALHREMDSLRQGISNTIETTQYNGIALLRGRITQPPALVDTSALFPPAVGASNGNATQSGSYALEITQLAGRGAVIGNVPATALPPGDTPTVMTITSAGGVAMAVITDSDPPASWPAIINAAAASIGVTAEITDATTALDDGTIVDPLGEGYLLLRTAGAGSPATITVSTNKVTDITGFTVSGTTGFGADMEGTLNGVAFTAVGLTINAGPGAGGAAGLSLTFSAPPPLGPNGSVEVTVPPEELEGLTYVVQYAPDYLDEHLVTIPSFLTGVFATSGAGTLGELDLTTQTNAQEAIDTIDAAVLQVSQARSRIGAHIAGLRTELEVAVNGSYFTNLSRSRIMDADMALEASNLAQQQLMQQASHAALAAIHKQSETATELVIQMLRTNPLAPAP
jgi:flagellin